MRSSSASSRVGAAKQTWYSGGRAKALGAVVGLWRDSRSEVVAELCEGLSAELERSTPALCVGNRAEMQREWLAVESERQASDLPRLLRALSETHFRSTDALVRAKRLERWPEDPRASRLLIDQLVHPRFHASSSRPFWAEVFALLQRQQDPRAVTWLKAYIGRLSSILREPRHAATRGWFRAHALETIEALAAPPVAKPLAQTEQAEARAWLRQLRSDGEEARRLLGAVLATRGAKRVQSAQVYGDRLLELGDPRGEFIALQTRGGDPKRERALIEQHANQWIGPLAGRGEVLSWEFGFPSEVRVFEDVSLDDAIGDPVWSTVRTLHANWSAEVARLLAHPRLGSLEALTTSRGVATTRSALPVRVLRLTDELDVALARQLSRTKALNRVESLSFAPGAVGAGALDGLRQLSWRSALHTVGLMCDTQTPDAGQLLCEIRELRQVKTLLFERSEKEWTLTLTRGVGRAGRWRIQVDGAKSWAAHVGRFIEAAVATELIERVALPADWPRGVRDRFGSV